MSIQIPFPLPSEGFALNSKMRVNLDFIVDQLNSFGSGSSHWDTIAIGTGSTTTGSIVLYNSSNNNTVTIQAGVTSPSHTYTLPTALPASTKYLQVTSGGTMSWTDALAGTFTGTLSIPAGTAAAPSIFATVNTDTGLYYTVSGVVLALSHEGTRFFGKETAGVFLEGIPNYTGSSLIYSVGGYLAELPNSQATTGIVSVASSQTPKVIKLLGTTNQIVPTFNANDVTLATPQNLDTSANFQVASIQTGAGALATCALRLNAANTGIFMNSSTEMYFAIAGATYASLDNTGSLVAASTVQAPVVKATTSMKLSTGGGSVITFIADGSAFGAYTLRWPLNDGAANEVLTTDGSGFLTWTAVTSLGGANTALSNLASVAINTTLVSDTNNTDDLGTSGVRWKTAYLSASLDISATSNQIVLGTTRTATLTAPTPATSSRTYTFADLSGDYDVVGTIGTQSISGTKTFSALALSGNLAAGSNKITGLANGTAATDSAAFGQLKVIQYVIGTSTGTTTTTSATFQTTGLTATITPTSSSNKVLIIAVGMLIANNTAGAVVGKSALASLFRSTTNLASAGGGFMAQTYNQVLAQAEYQLVTLQYVDSPATTSATTYAVKVNSPDGSTQSAWGNSETQTILLIELAA